MWPMTWCVWPIVLACVFGAMPARADGPVRAVLTEAGAGLDLLAREGADSSVLVGVPTRAQRARAADLARQTLSRLGEAKARLEARAQGLRATAERDERAARELAEITDGELGLRLPLLMARCHVVLAAAGPAEDAKSHADRALAELVKIEPGWTAGEALRRVTMGLALRWANKAEHPGVPTALDLLAGVVELPVGDDPTRTTPVGLSIEAHAGLALVRAGAGVGGGRERLEEIIASFRNAASEGALAQAVRRDPLTALFVDEVDARLRLRLDRAEERASAAADAHAGIAALLARLDPNARGEQAAFQRLVRDKIAACVEAAGARATELPMLSALAVGRAWVEDPSKQAEGVAVLLAVARREEAGALGADAMWLAATHMPAGTTAEQSELSAVLFEFGDRFGDSARAGEALGWLLDVTKVLVQRESTPAHEALRLRALERGLPVAPMGEAGDGLRVELAAMLLRPQTDPAAVVAGLRRGMELLDPIEPTSASRPTADEILSSAFGRARGFVGPMRVEAAKLGAEWASRRMPGLSSEYQLEVLDSLRADPALNAEALALARELSEPARAWAPPWRWRVAKARAELERAEGDDAAALATLKAFVASVDRPPTPPQPTPGGPGAAAEPSRARPAEFWAAWIVILELLEKGGDPGEVRLRIRQLELIDPALGAGEHEAALRVIERRVAG